MACETQAEEEGEAFWRVSDSGGQGMDTEDDGVVLPRAAVHDVAVDHVIDYIPEELKWSSQDFGDDTSRASGAWWTCRSRRLPLDDDLAPKLSLLHEQPRA